jgi:ribosomal-protein-alanine N-acetyltransferase
VSRVTLEQPSPRHGAEFLRAVRRSRDLHRGWVSPPNDRRQFDRYLKGLRHENCEGFLVVTSTDAIAGVVNVSEIVRGHFQSAYLGYYAFEPGAGQGLMRQGLQRVIAHCFGKLRLHRLEANIQPENLRSVALAQNLGFRCEGFSPRYLKIGGRWRDHQRWALLAEDWKLNRHRRGLA